MVIILFCLFFIILVQCAEEEKNMLYGLCYQFNELDSAQIIPFSGDKQIVFEDYGFKVTSNDPICCIWFTSNEYAYTASSMSVDAAEQNFKNNDNVQELLSSSSNQDGLIECNHQEIHIDHSEITSRHLCSDLCPMDNEDHSCSNIVAARTDPVSYNAHSDVSPLIPSMFGITGICIAFIIVCLGIYCFAIKYARWSQQKSGNETEQVIGDVLDEIAKYTIGDSDDEGVYGDWNDADSDRSESSHSVEEQLGMTILKVMSHQQLPEIPNPAINSLSSDYISSSSSSSSDDDDQQCREDLLVAKETLYATSFGINNPYSYSTHLSTIKERMDENKQIDITPKKSPLLSGNEIESSDCKISSDACNNSDLP